MDFDVSEDRIFVWDMENRWLPALTLEGEALISRDITGLSGRPQRLRGLPDGGLIVETEKTYFDDLRRAQDVCLEILSAERGNSSAV